MWISANAFEATELWNRTFFHFITQILVYLKNNTEFCNLSESKYLSYFHYQNQILLIVFYLGRNEWKRNQRLCLELVQWIVILAKYKFLTKFTFLRIATGKQQNNIWDKKNASSCLIIRAQKQLVLFCVLVRFLNDM